VDAPVAERVELLATRADLLLAVGDRGAPAAFAEAAAAAGADGIGLRIRQAWAQLATGDPAAGRATLHPLPPRSEGERAAWLIASAATAWFSGDPEAARAAAAEARPLAIAAGLGREARAATQIQAMVAHSLGTWPDTLQQDLDESLRAPDLAETLFDGHLCVAEYALTSGTPHDQVRALAEGLHARALRQGARRAQVLAATMLGGISLIAGYGEEAAELFQEAVRVSRDIGAVSAEALASVRLGEAVRAVGDLDQGNALLADGVAISAWSPISGHLQPLAYAALLRATDDAELGRGRLDEAETEMRGNRVCAYCGMAFRVSGAISAARAGQPERAAAFLTAAERGARLWHPGPWPAALEEVRGELALARGDDAPARAHLGGALAGFLNDGRQLDADRVATRLAGLG
jgi:hypothetical protein